MHHPTYRIAHTTAFVTPVVEHWLELEIALIYQISKEKWFGHFSFPILSFLQELAMVTIIMHGKHLLLTFVKKKKKKKKEKSVNLYIYILRH